MTPLKKTVIRKTTGTIREGGKVRQIVVELTPPHLIVFRAMGCKRRYALPVEACYVMAVRALVLAEKTEKQKIKRKV